MLSAIVEAAGGGAVPVHDKLLFCSEASKKIICQSEARDISNTHCDGIQQSHFAFSKFEMRKSKHDRRSLVLEGILEATSRAMIAKGIAATPRSGTCMQVVQCISIHQWV